MFGYIVTYPKGWVTDKTVFKKSACGDHFVIDIFIVLLNLKIGVMFVH